MHYLLNERTSVTGKKWILKQHNDRDVFKLVDQENISEITARLLIARGVSCEQAQSFLKPTLRSLMIDPWQLMDLDVAITRIIVAMQQGHKIAVFGDYDVDGATSTALLMRCLRAYGVDALFHIPDRITEGYGPNIQAMTALQDKGVKLIITVDCGTTAYEVLEQAYKIGLDVIVIDHHMGEPKQPQAVAVVNPNRFDQPDNPYKICAAVGIVFITMACLRRHLADQGIMPTDPTFDLMVLLDLVAVGTVCDVVPLTGINRAFVTQGLKILAARNNPGLTALMDSAQVDQQPTAYHLSFIIGPRINAGGRVGQCDLGVRLLTTDDAGQANNFAQQLKEYNIERQAIEQLALREAMDQGEQQQHQQVIITSSSTWHPGVIGIIAGRLKDRFNRPSFVISFDAQGLGKGSARSINGLDIGALIQAAKQAGLLINGGGHAMAGGITIDHNQLVPFTRFVQDKVTQMQLDLTPHINVDSHLKLTAATLPFVEGLNTLEPYGQSNPKPRFVFNDLFVTYSEIVGQDHLRITFKSYDGTSITAMAFRCLDTPLGQHLRQPGAQAITVLGTLKLDEWLGRKKITLMIEDIALG